MCCSVRIMYVYSYVCQSQVCSTSQCHVCSYVCAMCCYVRIIYVYSHVCSATLHEVRIVSAYSYASNAVVAGI